MASAEQDYQHFIQWLHQPDREVPEDVLRFGRLVLDNFESVRATTRNRSQRSALLVELARQWLAATDPDHPQLGPLTTGIEWSWQKFSRKPQCQCLPMLLSAALLGLIELFGK